MVNYLQEIFKHNSRLMLMEKIEKGEGSENLKRAVDLTNYLFSLPSLPVILAFMVIVAVLFGAILNLPPSQDFVRDTVLDAAVLLLFPALLTSLVVKVLIRGVPIKRILATAAAGEVVYGFAYAISSFVFGINPTYGELVLFVGAAIVFVVWYLVARLVFILKYRSILFAVLQLLFYLLFLFNSRTFQVAEASMMNLATRAYLASFILLGAIYLFFLIINAPMKKTFGLSSTDVFSLFISQWIYKKNDLEKAFERVGETVKTLVGIVGFERKDGRILFIVPYVHFGPFGNLGGSEFSHLIAEELEKRYPPMRAFVFHGPVTHDLNPTSSKEIQKIIDAISTVLKRAKYKTTSVSLAVGKSNECKAESLNIGNDAFIGLSRAPFVTEDINLGLGLAMLSAAEKKRGNAIIVDQHNAETGEITSFEPGSEIGYNYIKAVEEAVSKKTKEEPLKIGVSVRRSKSPAIGDAGIRIAVISSAPKYIIILLDANGITPQLKEKIEKEVASKYRCTVGVFTTDTHQTNAVRGVLNPAKEEPEIINEILEGTKEAIADMQPASAFVDKEWFDIRVLGAKHSIEIVSTVNSVVAVAKITAPLILIGAVLIILAILSKV